ncbi:hypothetical protein KIPB_001840 [Kipferlia bialata]|uniref:Uncharacterized protein n=1 Tax=Kipferlia bialata TaxID=797122 RepID=A0A391NS84_9EUKA|nr:hypothetical protein KIPB_001840 [Kipferlia bialata]|eukprot:g1840.t1
MAVFTGSLYHSARVTDIVFTPRIWTEILGVCSSSLRHVNARTVQLLVDRGEVTRVLKFIHKDRNVADDSIPDWCRQVLSVASQTKFVSADAMHEYLQALLVVRGVFYAVEGSHIGKAVFPFSK